MAWCINKLLQIPSKLLRRPNAHHNFSVSQCLRDNYEGDGKTTVSILNREHRELIMFDSYSKEGFRLNNGLFVLGAVAAFPRTVLHWHIEHMGNLTPAHFSLFSVLEPKLDILVMGTGDKVVQPPEQVLAFLKERRIATEILPTESACSVFNFLNAEGRCIAGALLPPSKIVWYDQDTKLLTDAGDVGPGPDFTFKLK